MPRDMKRLRKLAAYRARLERMQELRLAQARRDALERHGLLQQSRDRLDAMLSLNIANHGEVVDPVVLHTGSSYLVRMGREVEARSNALRHYRTLEQAERDEVLELRRDRRAMESLLEREAARAAYEERRAESARLDEQGARQWWRENHQPRPTRRIP